MVQFQDVTQGHLLLLQANLDHRTVYFSYRYVDIQTQITSDSLELNLQEEKLAKFEAKSNK